MTDLLDRIIVCVHWFKVIECLRKSCVFLKHVMFSFHERGTERVKVLESVQLFLCNYLYGYWSITLLSYQHANAKLY